VSQLCALQDVKTYLGISDTNSDSVLTNLITNVSAMIETYCNRIFALASYTETRNGGCGQKMYLANGPVTTVSSLSVNGQSVAAAPDSVSGGFVWDSMMVYIRRGGAGPQEFYKGIQNVIVTYTAGYASTPPEVNQACVMWVAWLYDKRKRLDKRNETLGQQQTIGFDLSDMPAFAKTALQAYVRWNSL
jgi:hypothetical protein